MQSTRLKRKSPTGDDSQDQPRKHAAISRPGALGPNRTVTNVAPRSANGLTVPAAPKLTKSTTASSAARNVPARRVVSSGSAPGTRRPATRSTTAARDGAFKQIQDQVTSLAAARDADNVRLAHEMDAERAKVAQLQSQMTVTRNQELNQRRELDSMIEELDAMRKKHARELMELEMDMRKKERENRELQEDVKCFKSDLDLEREKVSQLKATISNQSTADLARGAQMNALQAQLTTLQSTYAATVSQNAQLQLEMEVLHKDKERLRQEVIDGEMVRRKLHNTIQELKGNIRVFCRVRPALATDDEVAAITYPDPLDNKEIVVASSSESAMGNERKETWNFSFDKVGDAFMVLLPLLMHPIGIRASVNSSAGF
jgi:kinesin family member C1